MATPQLLMSPDHPDFFKSPLVFLDISTDSILIGRLYIELFPEYAPWASQNFSILCRGNLPPIELPKQNRTISRCYRGTPIHRIVSGYLMQGGDITMGDGTGGLCGLPLLGAIMGSAHAKAFPDENLGSQKFNMPGILCMANRGPNTNTSQFFITLGNDCSYLSDKHTLFGVVRVGKPVLEKISALQVDAYDRPLIDVRISDCGDTTFMPSPSNGLRILAPELFPDGNNSSSGDNNQHGNGGDNDERGNRGGKHERSGSPSSERDTKRERISIFNNRVTQRVPRARK